MKALISRCLNVAAATAHEELSRVSELMMSRLVPLLLHLWPPVLGQEQRGNCNPQEEPQRFGR